MKINMMRTDIKYKAVDLKNLLTEEEKKGIKIY